MHWLKIQSLLLLAGLCAGSTLTQAGAIHDHPGEYDTIAQLWAGVDPTAGALDIKVLDSWTSAGIEYSRLYFTGEIWEGEPTRIYAIQGAPAGARGLPGILHIHGGGQTANLDWVTFWAKRGYACVSFDYCGDWTEHAPERKLFTQWGRYAGDMKFSGNWMLPNARHNQWFHWAYTSRRALTLLAQHPACDPERIGIYGISMGGTLTWLVAAMDPRVKAAAAIYGCGWNSYDTPEQMPSDPVSNPEVLAWRELLQPESYAALINIPLLFLNATQDFHGKMDRCDCTQDLLTAPIKRQVYTPRYSHHIEPREGKSLPLWMDWHLKGEGGPWPATPQLTWDVQQSIPQLTLSPDRSEAIESVEIHYALNNRFSTSRFWRTTPATRTASGSWTIPTPFFNTTDTLFAFANVTYQSGVTISSRLLTQAAPELPAAAPSLEWSEQIDAMQTGTDWFYVPAYTDPQLDWSYFIEWTGPEGERGFTLNPKCIQVDTYPLNIATYKLGDPQWQGKPGFQLALDYFAPQPFTELTVKLVENEGRPDRHEYSLEIQAESAGQGWRTIPLTPDALKDTEGKPLPGWEAVNMLNLIGKSPAAAPPVFRNLRWVK